MTAVLYLCQHGEALAEELDPDRPLSKRGESDIRDMAEALGGSVDIDAIIHSGKTRARQTAELFHQRLAPQATVRPVPGLNPNDPVDAFIQRFGDYGTNTMVVSHLPFVSKLVSHLLGQSDRDILMFQPGTVAALTLDAGGDWMLTWMLNPALVSD